MKRFWVVLLSLGLVMAFSASAFALQADFEGQYYARGWYISNPNYVDKDGVPTGYSHQSIATADQRFRLYTTFKPSDNMRAKLRMDIWEDKWGTTADPAPEIQTDWASISFNTKIGSFDVGYIEAPVSFGPKLLNSTSAKPGVRYTNKLGDLTIGAVWMKSKENGEYDIPYVAAQSDVESDTYGVNAIYKVKGFEVGVQGLFLRDASKRDNSSTGGYTVAMYQVDPYIKAKFGPIELEAEGVWVTGDAKKYDKPSSSKPDSSAEGFGGYVDAKINMGPAYFGASYAYLPGDDKTTADKQEGSWAKALGAGSSFKPGLLMFYSDYRDQAGKYYTNPYTGDTFENFDNANLVKVYGGFKASKDLELWAAFWTTKMSQTPSKAYVSDNIGSEFDLTATYTIYDGLTYELAFAYFKTGDYFKGTNSNNKIDDNYFLRHTIKMEF